MDCRLISRQHLWGIAWCGIALCLAVSLPLSYGDPPPRGCGGTYNASNGNLSDKYLIPEDNCYWHITPVNSTSDTFLIFEGLILFEGDQLSILNEQNETISGPFDETQGPFSILTGEKNVTVKLVIGKKTGSRKFAAFYNASGCSHNFRSPLDVGYLSSPLYLNQSRGQIHCSFIAPITDASDYRLLLDFKRFNFSADSKVNISGIVLPNDKAELSDLIIDDHLDITIVLNPSAPDQGFLFTYQRVFKACSDVIKVSLDKSTQVLKPPAIDSQLKLIPRLIECRWIVQADFGVISVKIQNLTMKNGNDYLAFFNGGTYKSPSLLYVTPQSQNETTDLNIMTSGSFLMVAYSSLTLDTSNGFEITVMMRECGGYFNTNASFGIESKPKRPLQQPAMFLLEVPEGLQVSLNVSSTQTKAGVLSIYDSFYGTANQIAEISSGGQIYPVVSSGHQMMVLAKGFVGDDKFSAHFSDVKKGCYEVSSVNIDAYSASAASCNLTCSWVILASKDIAVREIYLHPSLFSTHDQMVNVSMLDSTFQAAQLFNATGYHIPAFRLPSNSHILVTTSQRSCSKEADVTFNGNYVTIPSCVSTSTMTAGQQQMVASPGFPNTYPLNSDCWWNVSSPTMYAIFNTLQLAPSHSVQLFDSKGPIPGYDNITSDAPGLLVDKGLNVHFLSPLDKITLASGYGFQLTILALDEGRLVKDDDGHLTTPEYPKPVDKNWTSIWIIQVEAKNKSVSTILYNFTFVPQTETQTVISIHDGPSIHSEVNTNMSDLVHWSRTNTLVVVYNFTKEKESGPSFSISYSIKICDHVCGNGLCLHDDWLCNGHNDCGDNTDEIDCHASPTAPPTPSPTPSGETKTGVSPVAVGILTPFMFLLGVLVALTVPALYRRYRAGHRYAEFSNVGVE